MTSLEEAIGIYEDILHLRPSGHEKHAEAVSNLGEALFSFCFHVGTNTASVHRCFELLREALRLRPPGNPLRDHSLHHLAKALYFIGYKQQSGDSDTLTESIQLNREALQLRPVTHPQRVNSLNNLACALRRSFEHCGKWELLEESIGNLRHLLQLLEPGHWLRASSLTNLAMALQESFQHQGGFETLAEAISLHREALQLCPVGHTLRWSTLENLARAIRMAFSSQRLPELLSEVTELDREVLQLMPVTHLERGRAMSNLADSLLAKFRQHRDQSTLAEAVGLLRQALGLLRTGHLDRDIAVYNLAEALFATYNVDRDSDHLYEAIKLHREALTLRPLGNVRRLESLQRLANLLCRAEIGSWAEAVDFYREALDLSPPGYPARARLLFDSSKCLLEPSSPFFNLSEGITRLSEGYSDPFTHVNQQLRCAVSELGKVEDAYNVSTETCDPQARQHLSRRILELYSQVISLLPRAANLGLNHATRLQAVVGTDEIARNAAARAIRMGRVSQAVEMLEEGRGVFWSHTLRLRSDAFDDVPVDDASELQGILRRLEHEAHLADIADSTPALREMNLEKRRQLNQQAEALIAKIRGYPGLSRFLMPAPFASLVSSLPPGYTVILNASKLGHYALIINGTTRFATSLKLGNSHKGFDSETIRWHVDRNPCREEAPDKDAIRATRFSNGRQLESMEAVLALVWTSIVEPVINNLGLKVGNVSPLERINYDS
jgi:tetratricopeptide (TPR) repeat protein